MDRNARPTFWPPPRRSARNSRPHSSQTPEGSVIFNLGRPPRSFNCPGWAPLLYRQEIARRLRTGASKVGRRAKPRGDPPTAQLAGAAGHTRTAPTTQTADTADTAEFARLFTRFIQTMTQAADDQGGRGLTALGEKVSGFLGVDLNTVDPVTELFAAHQVVDLDLALEQLIHDHHGERFGVSGLHRGQLDTFARSSCTARTPTSGSARSASSVRRPGPTATAAWSRSGWPSSASGISPWCALQRAANPQYGRELYSLEILCPRPDVVESTLVRIRQLMSELSVLRGQVMSFQSDAFNYRAPGSGMTFLARPEVQAEQVILPPGVLERVTRHVVGIGDHKETLLAAGQHLKRGILLYGPPGTGKTHLVRHLLTRDHWHHGGAAVRPYALLARTTPPSWPAPPSRRSSCWRTATSSRRSAAATPTPSCSRPLRRWTGSTATRTSRSS